MVRRSRTTVRVFSVGIAVVITAGCAANGVESAGSRPASPSNSHPGRIGATGKGGAASKSGAVSKGGASTARRDLRSLRTRTPGTMTGYSRAEFGRAWKDVDHNGCDTRNDILARDLTKVRKRDTCVVIVGNLDDPYTGKDIAFAKSRPSEVQIDHVVPLALAWRMGANRWSEDKRTELANDRDNLLAVWSRPNAQKRDKGPAEWSPRTTFQCAYATRFIGVAHEYDLAVTTADRGALGSMLDRC